MDFIQTFLCQFTDSGAIRPLHILAISSNQTRSHFIFPQYLRKGRIWLKFVLVTRQQKCETLGIQFGWLKEQPFHNPCLAFWTEEANNLLALPSLYGTEKINSFGLCSVPLFPRLFFFWYTGTVLVIFYKRDSLVLSKTEIDGRV